MKEMPSSIQEETGSVTHNHDGSGNNTANTGRGAMHTGTGDLFQNEITGNVHFGNKKYNGTRLSPDLTCMSQGLAIRKVCDIHTITYLSKGIKSGSSQLLSADKHLDETGRKHDGR